MKRVITGVAGSAWCPGTGWLPGSRFSADIAGLMAGWNKIAAAAEAQFPTASEEELYQITKGAMNHALKLRTVVSPGVIELRVNAPRPVDGEFLIRAQRLDKAIAADEARKARRQ